MRWPIRFFSACLLLTLLTGCAWLKDEEKIAKQKAETELKRTRFADLQQRVENNTLARGTSTKQIEETYGQPESVFHSGSVSSSFDIWTYERVMPPGEEDWQPIRLYFNNGKLESWKY